MINISQCLNLYASDKLRDAENKAIEYFWVVLFINPICVKFSTLIIKFQVVSFRLQQRWRMFVKIDIKSNICEYKIEIYYLKDNNIIKITKRA